MGIPGRIGGIPVGSGVEIKSTEKVKIELLKVVTDISAVGKWKILK